MVTQGIPAFMFRGIYFFILEVHGLMGLVVEKVAQGACERWVGEGEEDHLEGYWDGTDEGWPAVAEATGSEDALPEEQ